MPLGLLFLLPQLWHLQRWLDIVHFAFTRHRLPLFRFLLDFQLDSNLELFMDSFRSTLLCMFHLSTGGPSGMVFEHLQDSFNPKDLASGFIQFHQLCSHVVVDCIYGSSFRANWFLVLAKPFNDIHLIIVGRALYRLASKALCLKFFAMFVFHLSPYRFKMTIRRGCEVMVHGF
jgi:hypothetical protein